MLEPLSICALQGGRLLSLSVGEFPAEADEVTHCVLNTLEDLLYSLSRGNQRHPCLSLC